MILISCPELLKHFLFQINSNKEEGKPGIRRAMRKADSDLPAELLASADKKISWHASPSKFFQMQLICRLAI